MSDEELNDQVRPGMSGNDKPFAPGYREGVLCSNDTCEIRMACARFWDPIRHEFANDTSPPPLQHYLDRIDHCYKVRPQLIAQPTGDPFQKQRRHYNKGGGRAYTGTHILRTKR